MSEDDFYVTPKLVDRVSKSKLFKQFSKTRKDLLVDGDLQDITEFASTLGVVHPAAITSQLFRVLYPWSEDGVHGIKFHERIEDLIKSWKKAFANHDLAYGDFSMVIETYVKEVKSHEDVRVFRDGKLRTKKIYVWVACHPGDWNEPVLTFGLEKVKLVGE